MKKILIKFWCWFDGHDWTCKASEGIKPTANQLSWGVIGFYDYARMHCKRCGETYP